MSIPTQRISASLRNRLDSDGLSVTWWKKPHRSWGWVKNVSAFVENDDTVIIVGTSQSFSVLAPHPAREAIDLSLAHAETSVAPDFLSPVLDILEATALPWKPDKNIATRLGASHHGLNVEWLGLETERRWLGQLEDIDNATLRLWQILNPLILDP